MTSSQIHSSDEPVTPAGRLFLRPEMDQIIHCAIGLANPPDAAATRSVLANSIMIGHPRFQSLLVRDKNGREHWRKTDVDMEQHIIEIGDEVSIPDSDREQAVNDYLADLAVSSPLSTDKPLWELHLLKPHKCVVLRLHHALGDGISLMSLLLAACRCLDDPNRSPMIDPPRVSHRKFGSFWMKIWMLFKVFWFTMVYGMGFIGRSLWVSDRKTALSGGAGVEDWPRKLATARFRLDDLKAIKKALSNFTINDVVFGVLSFGFSRYLEFRSQNVASLQEGLQITGLAMVNLRKQPGLHDLEEMVRSESGLKWGNEFGVFLLPVFYHKTSGDPLQFLKRAKAMLDKKKLSLEAQLSYKLGDLVMSWLGPKAACVLNYRIVCNTTFTFSNVIGPQEEIMLANNPVTYFRANSSSLSHAITMHLVSYAGRADMQILVAKDIIPDPQFLAKCFEDALMEFKEAVVKKMPLT